jgi:hypothetical protein
MDFEDKEDREDTKKQISGRFSKRGLKKRSIRTIDDLFFLNIFHLFLLLFVEK